MFMTLGLVHILALPCFSVYLLFLSCMTLEHATLYSLSSLSSVPLLCNSWFNSLLSVFSKQTVAVQKDAGVLAVSPKTSTIFILVMICFLSAILGLCITSHVWHSMGRKFSSLLKAVSALQNWGRFLQWHSQIFIHTQTSASGMIYPNFTEDNLWF